MSVPRPLTRGHSIKSPSSQSNPEAADTISLIVALSRLFHSRDADTGVSFNSQPDSKELQFLVVAMMRNLVPKESTTTYVYALCSMLHS